MVYFTKSILLLFIIFSFSNFLNRKFNIEHFSKYLITVLILILFSFFILKSIFIINSSYGLNLEYLKIFKYLFIFLTFLSCIVINFKNLKINISDIYFFIFYLLVCSLTFDRYFLDEDEFAYWGPKIKELYYSRDYIFLKFNTYHQPLLASWQLLVSAFVDFNENLLIFSNNIILISSFFYLIGDTIKSHKKKHFIIFLYFLIFYLVVNNLSFGFISIYADPILGVLSACIVKILYKNKYDLRNIFILLTLILSLTFVHRLGIILSIIFLLLIVLNFLYFFLDLKKISSIILSKLKTDFFIKFLTLEKTFIFFLLSLTSLLSLILINHSIYLVTNLLIVLFMINYFNKSSKYRNIFLINKIIKITIFIASSKIILNLFFVQLNYSTTAFNILGNYELMYDIVKNFLINLKKILTVNVYYSSFGISLNKILETIFNKDYILDIYDLSILSWVLVIFVFFLINKNKIFGFYFLSAFLIYLLIIFTEKIFFQNLSYLVFGRYVAIFLLPFMLFLSLNNLNKHILYILLLGNIFITPLKSYGYFVPDKIYYSYEKNFMYHKDRDTIKKLSIEKSMCKNKSIIVLHDYENYPAYLNGHYSLINHILKYEFYEAKLIFGDINELDSADFLNIYDCMFLINIDNQKLIKKNLYHKNISYLNL